MKEYDVIVIGTGAGNIILEEALAKGLSCAQIEKGKFGGTCLTRGCIPTKVLATFADKILELKELSKIGINVEGVSFDWEKASERVWEKIDESKMLRDFYLNQKNLDVYEGRGFFVKDKVLKVELNSGEVTDEITAKQIFIGIGGRTNVPFTEGLEEAGYITSETFFGDEYPKKPYKSLAIIGGGAIATEFAHIFNALGTKVDIIIRSENILNKEDEEISKLMSKRFKARGININNNTQILAVEKEANKKILTLKNKNTNEIKELPVEEILVASGIRSNSDYIEIQNTTIKTDEKGWIKTNEFLETSVEGVFAFGDINGLAQFRHKANYEADILAYNNFISENKSDYRFARYDVVPAVTFTYPQVAHVGLNEQRAEEKGYNIQVGKHYYNQTAKGFSLGYGEEDDEFAKVIIEKSTKKILGFNAVGHESSLLIQPYVNLMNAGDTKLVVINEDIASELTKERRKNPISRQMNPNLMSTVRETMVPHPALSEVGIWTYYYIE